MVAAGASSWEATVDRKELFMNRTTYWLFLLMAAWGFAAVATWGARSGGPRRLWLASSGVIVLLLLLGLLDRMRTSVSETPLHTYALIAVAPTLAATVLIQWLVSRGASVGTQVLAGGLTWFCVSVLALLSAFYP